MPRSTNGKDLIDLANKNFEKLLQIVDSMPDIAISTEFNFSNDLKKTEAHWKRDKNLRDIFIHLYEWHQLLLKWVKSNVNEEKRPFLPEPYTWKTYGQMNIKFWEDHQNTKLEESKKMLKESHKETLKLIESFSDKELFEKKYFDWTGTTSLGSYCVSATSSHYDWAIKKIRAHIKKCTS